MKVAMLGWEFPPFVSGGLGVHCFHLTRALCKLGVKIDFFMPASGKHILPSHPALRIFEVSKVSQGPYLSFSQQAKSLSRTYGENILPSIEKYNLQCHELVKTLHAKEKYDILHAHDWLTASAARSLKQELSIPAAHTMHSTEFDRNAVPWSFIADIERGAIRNADIVITVSNRMKRQLAEKFGADEKKVRVIYNGVESEEFESKNNSSKISLPILQNKKKVLFLGRLTGQKAPAEFLRAAKEVLRLEPNTAFLVAGTGDMLPHLLNLSIELGIQKSVIFLGYLSDGDRKKIYAQCDVYVMPSVSEPFGITALEAMASGTPTIISTNSGVGEAVKTVLRIDFWDTRAMAEKIIAILRYSPLSNTMSGMSHSEARQFTWDAAARETLKVYDGLLAHRK